MKRIREIAAAALAVLVLAGCSSGTTELTHVHGLGFSADGKELTVAAHDGFRIYGDGKWRNPGTSKYDLMGYTPVDNGFYSSGHPEAGSTAPNPIGLVKSADGGKTLTKLGFEGQSDFHTMGVGYKSHAIYLFNTAQVGKMGPGLYASTDEGKTWKAGAMKGLPSQPYAVAVHPTDPKMVALGAAEGLFLSKDGGDSFSRVSEEGVVSAAIFTPTGESLLYGYKSLASFDLAQQKSRPLQTPKIESGDAIVTIAVSPNQISQLAFGTVGRNVFLSADGGQTWKQIAAQGKGQASKQQ